MRHKDAVGGPLSPLLLLLFCYALFGHRLPAPQRQNPVRCCVRCVLACCALLCRALCVVLYCSRLVRGSLRVRSYPFSARCGVVPGGFLRLPSWASCAAVVLPAWTGSRTPPVARALQFPVPSALRHGCRPMRRALLCGRRQFPLRVGGRHARVSCACVCRRVS